MDVCDILEKRWELFSRATLIKADHQISDLNLDILKLHFFCGIIDQVSLMKELEEGERDTFLRMFGSKAMINYAEKLIQQIATNIKSNEKKSSSNCFFHHGIKLEFE